MRDELRDHRAKDDQSRDRLRGRHHTHDPRRYDVAIKDGDPATITVSVFPNRNFTGTVTRHPDALDQTTRTMLVEVDLPNQDRSL